jgi:coproporphyrinogen III oxidase-like Fe-S oxidoreductase
MLQLKMAGVQRLSVGVQSFDDEILKAMDRYHKYGSGKQIIDRIKSAQGYFNTLNIDMMFGFPKQTQEKLEKDLAIINELKVDQVTFYPLMLSTMTQREVREKMGNMREGSCKGLYEKIRQTLGHEYRSRTAWCFSRNDSMIDEYVVNYDEYAGVGSGAFGYIQGTVYANTFDLAEYISRANQGEFPISARRNCSPLSLIFYDFLMQFFDLSIDLKQLKKKHGLYLTLLILPVICFFLLVGGIASKGARGVFVTTNPYFGVIMMREFFTSVNNFRDYCRLQSNLELNTESCLEQPVPI